MQSSTEATSDRVLWQADLARFLNIDRVTVYRMERDGRLPKPDIVQGRRRGRFESTMREFARASAAGA